MKILKFLIISLFLLGSINAYALWSGNANFSNVNLSNLNSNDAQFSDGNSTSFDTNINSFDVNEGGHTVRFSNEPDQNTDALTKLTAEQIASVIKQAIAKSPTQAAILAEALVARVPKMAAIVTFAAVQASPNDAAAIAKAVTTAVPSVAYDVANAAIKADPGQALAIADAVTKVQGLSNSAITGVSLLGGSPQSATTPTVLATAPAVNQSVLGVGNTTSTAAGTTVNGQDITTVKSLIDATALSPSS